MDIQTALAKEIDKELGLFDRTAGGFTESVSEQLYDIQQIKLNLYLKKHPNAYIMRLELNYPTFEKYFTKLANALRNNEVYNFCGEFVVSDYIPELDNYLKSLDRSELWKWNVFKAHYDKVTKYMEDFEPIHLHWS